jgi:prepilin-type N-terminal cleavage/methylation domain-containing protein
VKDKIRKQDGFTLLEILVSLMVLGFVIIAFIPFITQAAIHNRVNGETLKTNEAAQMVASEYRFLDQVGNIHTSLPNCPNTAEINLESSTIGEVSYATTVTLCNFEKQDVDNLVQAVFTVRSEDNQLDAEGTARKFLLEAGDDYVQAP